MSEQSLWQKVYDELFRRIIAKELLPGDVLDRRRLAEELGVSLSPVVHALGRLDHEGFLEVLPRRGTRLRVIRREDFRGQMLARNALECQAARVICGRPVEENGRRLQALAKRVDATRVGRRINWEAEVAFHRALVAMVGCPVFLREYDRVMRVGLFVLVSTFSESNPFPIDPSRSWHADLVGKLRTAKPDVAERALREHLEMGRETYLAAGDGEGGRMRNGE